LEQGKNQLSIVIPAYKNALALSRTLTSIEPFRSKFEDVIVCNDGDWPGISKTCKNFSNVTEIPINSNIGSYGARNKDIDFSSSNYIAFIDSGVTISEKWVSTASDCIQKNLNYCSGPIKMILNERPDTYELYEAEFAFDVQAYIERDHFAPTANLLVSAKTFLEVGRFIEDLKSGGDTEFGKRVYTSQIAQIFSNDLLVFHPARTKEELLQKARRTTHGLFDLATLQGKKLTVLKVLKQDSRWILSLIFKKKTTHISKLRAITIRLQLLIAKLKALKEKRQGLQSTNE